MPNDTDIEANSDEQNEPTSSQIEWIDAIEEMFNSAVDHQAEIEIELEDMDVKVPLQLGEDPSYADWKLNGTIKLRFDGVGGPLAEWLRYYARGELPTPRNRDSPESE